jgi:predicted nucleic acid-binding protein
VRVVLDADVLIGALDADDPHHRQARTLFRSWQRQEASRLISLVNLTEVLIAPAAERQRLRAAREAIAALGVTIHLPNEAFAAPTRSASPTPTVSAPPAPPTPPSPPSTRRCCAPPNGKASR